MKIKLLLSVGFLILGISGYAVASDELSAEVWFGKRLGNTCKSLEKVGNATVSGMGSDIDIDASIANIDSNLDSIMNMEINKRFLAKEIKDKGYNRATRKYFMGGKLIRSRITPV